MKDGQEAVSSVKQAPSHEKKGFIDKSTDVLVNLLKSPERTTELLAAQIMMAIEISHDMQLYPAKYGMTQDQAGTYFIHQEPPMTKWAWDHMGDIWEISAGHTALRLGFFALNQTLKSEPVKGVQKAVLANDKARGLVGKVVGDERAQELAQGAEIQISDDACFWTSLLTTFTIKAVHSMGWISLFHIHDHMDNPVPGMIFGQVVAASILAATHYTAKNRESIKDLAIRIGKNVITGVQTGAQSIDKRLREFGEQMPERMEQSQERVQAAFDRLQARMEAFQQKVENWKPQDQIPTPDELIQMLLGDRASKAKANLNVETNDADDESELT